MLAIAGSRYGLRFVVADPWEIRSAGLAPCNRASRGVALHRLIRRENPTALAGTRAIRGELRRVSRGVGLGVVTRDLPTLPLAVAADLYPELPLMAPAKATKHVAVRAIAAVLHANIPPRKYATHRK